MAVCCVLMPSIAAFLYPFKADFFLFITNSFTKERSACRQCRTQSLLDGSSHVYLYCILLRTAYCLHNCIFGLSGLLQASAEGAGLPHMKNAFSVRVLISITAGIPPPQGSDDAQLLTMSTLNEEGVMNVKQVACDRLLSSRVETKLQVRLTCSCLSPLVLALPIAMIVPCMSAQVHAAVLLGSLTWQSYLAVLCWAFQLALARPDPILNAYEKVTTPAPSAT